MLLNLLPVVIIQAYMIPSVSQYRYVGIQIDDYLHVHIVVFFVLN